MTLHVSGLMVDIALWLIPLDVLLWVILIVARRKPRPIPDTPYPRRTTMTEPTRVAGKVGPHRPSTEPRLEAHNFLAVGVTPVSGHLDTDVTKGLTDWGMDSNDVHGCCGPAATDHNNVAKLGNLSILGTIGQPAFRGLLDAYFAYGLAQGEPGPEPDQGVSNASWLGFLYQHGVIYGYAQVPAQYVDWFVQQFNGVIVGSAINDQRAVEDFQSHTPWDAMLDADGGHDTLIVKTASDGSGEVVTWGGLQGYTAAFRDTNMQDFWVIFDKDDPQVDHDKFRAALEAVHGVAAPVQDSASFITDAVHSVEAEVEKAWHESVAKLQEAEVALRGFVHRVVNKVDLPTLITDIQDWAKRFGL